MLSEIGALLVKLTLEHLIHRCCKHLKRRRTFSIDSSAASEIPSLSAVEFVVLKASFFYECKELCKFINNFCIIVFQRLTRQGEHSLKSNFMHDSSKKFPLNNSASFASCFYSFRLYFFLHEIKFVFAINKLSFNIAW